ncbi:MAG: ABC transporter permease subunit [Eubacteriales bacterium SKADARSKE-1]|nr:ABC transporter permease subunit [Eubacteriales bacterium SKADARSKE-1]
MSKLLKVDFYKMFKTKSFYIIGIILLSFTTLIAITTSLLCVDAYQNIGNFTSDLGETAIDASVIFPGIFSTIASTLSSIVTYTSIFMIMFMCSEFSYGTIKNIASKGYRRESIYLSKFICGIACTFIYTAVVVVANLVVAVIIVGNKIPHYFDLPSQFFTSISLTLLLLISYISLALMIASLIRGNGASIGAFFVLSILTPILLPKADELLKNVIETDFTISKYSLSTCLLQVTGADLTKAFNGNDLTRFICVAVGFLVVTSTVGIYFFRKRDL